MRVHKIIGPVRGSWIFHCETPIFPLLRVFGIDPVAGEQDKGTIAQNDRVQRVRHKAMGVEPGACSVLYDHGPCFVAVGQYFCPWGAHNKGTIAQNDRVHGTHHGVHQDDRYAC